MTVSTLDSRSALIVIDLQKGIVGLPTAHPAATVVAKAGALAQAFRRHGMPVVLVNVAGAAPGRAEQARKLADLPADWADLVGELGVEPGDHRVTKRSWGAFTGTGLAEHLRAQQVTQVVIVGISTSIGVESTARQAHELGFHVTLAVDAMTDLSADAHENSIRRIFPRMAETGSTAEVLALLERRA